MSNPQSYEQWAQAAYENILDTLDRIHLNKVTILTGDNGTGKSLIRKVLASSLKDENNGVIPKLAHTSMEQRTGLHSEMGGGGVFLRDNEYSATSSNSIHFIKGVLNSSHGRYVVIDEPEIGMSLSMQASVGEWLNKTLTENKEKYLGVLVITHSKEIVRRLTCSDTFVNIQGLDMSGWLNQEPELIDLDEFDEKSTTLFKLLQEHLRPVNRF